MLTKPGQGSQKGSQAGSNKLAKRAFFSKSSKIFVGEFDTFWPKNQNRAKSLLVNLTLFGLKWIILKGLLKDIGAFIKTFYTYIGLSKDIGPL